MREPKYILLKEARSFMLMLPVVLSACSSGMATTTDNTQSNLNPAPNDQPADTSSKLERLNVSHHKVECEGYQVGLCMLVQREGSDEWEYLYEPIEGFEYQWGVDYEILVEANTTSKSLMGPTTQYSLVEVLEQTARNPGDQFTYVSHKSHERIVELSDGSFSLLGNKSFNCDGDNCAALQSAIAQNHCVVMSFQYNESLDQPLVLNEVLCSDSMESFTTSCL